MPPMWMWHLNDELEVHFEDVKERRSSGQPSSNGHGRGDDNRMMRNEYAKGRGRAVTE